ncbi:serine/threonine protein kinase [Cystobacter fuscus]|uniref:serine/threonine protein kinase n=1 Tax=Cystobacter fuscus TaxID=43 RepID=UPI002B28CE2D|nr:serine/threonine protein kinase [Cystobacter fuscus]
MSSAYRLTGRIEAGELAELYEAVQEPDGSGVVIKLFHPKTSDPRYATTLAATYSVLNPLRSEGIVHVLDMGFVKNRLVVVREAVDGSNLGVALQRLNTKEVLLPPAVALSLVIQLLESVERAHAEGIVHGALTPGNVLLSRAGVPHVCDFGALHALLAVPELKRAFVGRGRSAYRAPEVGRGGEPDVLSDVYSIGAIAYELLTLREAVIPEGGISTRRAGLPPPSRLDRRVHARLDPLILCALEPTPTRRFRSCAEFATALRGFLANQGGLPGAEDQRRFMTELLPNQVSFGASGPVPLTERFTLTPISGVTLAQVSADALDKSVVARPSFSPALSEADTMDAPPAFEEYSGSFDSAPAPPRPAPHVSEHPTLDRTGSADTHIRERALLHPSEAGSDEREDDAPSSVGRSPLGAPGDEAPTWVAPPGAAPVRSRRAVVPLGASREGTRTGRNPRLRVVEDFTRPVARPDTDDLIDTAPLRARPAPARVAAPPPEPEPAPEPVPPTATAPELPAVIAERQRMLTEERNLLEDAWSRRRMLAVASAIALVGLACFALGVWKFSQPPPVDTDPKVEAVSGAVQQYLQETPPAAEPLSPPSAVPPPAPTPEPPAASSLEPVPDASKANLAWITLEANRPARAYIDGVRVKRPLPLVHYPLKPGTRQVTVETLRVPRQREVFTLRLERGEHKKVEQIFPAPRRR